MRRTIGVLFLAACSHNAYSPPARMQPLAGPQPLAAGRTGLGLDGAVGGVAYSPSLITGSLEVSHGFADDLEGDASITLAHADFISKARTDPDAAAGELAAKVGLNRWMALRVGVGGGAWAGGDYVSADGMAIVGWENCVLVPFGALRLDLSQPINAQPVDLAQKGDMPGQFIDTPSTTMLVSLSVGIKVPLGASTRCAPAPIELLGSFQAVHVFNRDGDDGGASLGLGARFSL